MIRRFGAIIAAVVLTFGLAAGPAAATPQAPYTCQQVISTYGAALQIEDFAQGYNGPTKWVTVYHYTWQATAFFHVHTYIGDQNVGWMKYGSVGGAVYLGGPNILISQPTNNLDILNNPPCDGPL